MRAILLLRSCLVGLVGGFVWLSPSAAVAADVRVGITTPVEMQVVQRTTRDVGVLDVSGPVSAPAGAVVEATVGVEWGGERWVALTELKEGQALYRGVLPAPAGGWHRLRVRVRRAAEVLAEEQVARVGVGEVFVVAGQSNSANHGEEKQTPQTGRVAAFDGTKWQLANDPQPGAGGKGGSLMPPLGDALARKFNVPIGFVACGIGATSVREWLPKGATFPNPPTLTGRVEQLADGQWASKGAAVQMFVARMKALGPQGFRAVLWHQGESDANQKDPTRTLPGKLYRQHLEQLIRESRRAIGWDAPWFVAQASYHVPGDEGSDDIRAAQASLWKDGLALAGPDSDALKGDLRERNGQGVHFSGKGLREHAAKWAEKISPWLEQQRTAP